MPNRALVTLFAVLLAAPLFATETKIYASYETIRQALLKNATGEVQKSATTLAATARAEKQPGIATQAQALARAADLAAARKAFAALSDEVIKFRAAGSGQRPAVAYCSMEKKSWLQPGGSVENPYVGASMRACGEIKQR